MSDSLKLSRALLNLRLSRGWTQQQVVEMARKEISLPGWRGITTMGLSKIERGLVRAPRARSLGLLANVYGVDVTPWLIEAGHVRKEGSRLILEKAAVHDWRQLAANPPFNKYWYGEGHLTKAVEERWDAVTGQVERGLRVVIDRLEQGPIEILFPDAEIHLTRRPTSKLEIPYGLAQVLINLFDANEARHGREPVWATVHQALRYNQE